MMNKHYISLGVIVGVTSATVTAISNEQCLAMKNVGVMSPSAPVSCQRLKQVTFNYRDWMRLLLMLVKSLMNCISKGFLFIKQSRLKNIVVMIQNLRSSHFLVQDKLNTVQ